MYIRHFGFTVSMTNGCVDGDLILQPRFKSSRRCNQVQTLKPSPRKVAKDRLVHGTARDRGCCQNTGNQAALSTNSERSLRFIHRLRVYFLRAVWHTVEFLGPMMMAQCAVHGRCASHLAFLHPSGGVGIVGHLLCPDTYLTFA